MPAGVGLASASSSEGPWSIPPGLRGLGADARFPHHRCSIFGLHRFVRDDVANSSSTQAPKPPDACHTKVREQGNNDTFNPKAAAGTAPMPAALGVSYAQRFGDCRGDPAQQLVQV